MSTAELRDRLLTSHSRISSLVVSYVAGPVKIPRERVTATFAADGNRRARILWHNEAGSFDRDTDASHAVFDGKSWDIMRSYFRRLEVSTKFAVPPYTDKIRSHPFLENLGWWPTGDASTRPTFAEGRSFFLCDVLRGSSLGVSPRLSLVDGAWCHTVEVHKSEVSSKPLHAIYIDANLDVVRRHEIFDVQGALLVEFELGEYQNIEQHIWLPFRLRRRIAATPEIDVETIVQHYVVNSVDERVFRIVRPPGTLVYDRDADTFDQVPGGLELLDKVRAEAIPRRSNQTSGGNGVFLTSAVFLLSTVSIMVVVRLGPGRRRIRSSRTGAPRCETPEQSTSPKPDA
ncbi:MAG: hypothetical protein FJ297_16285 [Planctomycetes bacterium]|nr:hypothetical protein [Planctomycetota bacterium]